jgi:hypothetical protein
MRCNIVVSDLLFLQYGTKCPLSCGQERRCFKYVRFYLISRLRHRRKLARPSTALHRIVYQIDEDLECHIPRNGIILNTVHGT